MCEICVTLSKIVGMIRASEEVIGIIISDKEMQGCNKVKERNLWLGSGCSVSKWFSHNCTS
jgi:hypothetical protein